MFFYHEPEVDIIIFNSTIGREDGTDCRFEDVNTVLFHKIDKCEKMIVVKNIIRVKKIIMDKTANKKITVIGHANVDVMACPVDFSKIKAGSQPMEDILVSYGGGGLNEAVILKRLGADVELVSKLADDEAGEQILRFIKSEGISDKGIIMDTSGTGCTSVNVVLVDNGGERYFLTNPGGSNRKMENQDIEPLLDTGSDMVSFAAMFVSPLLDIGALGDIFKVIKARPDRILAVDMTKPKNGETLEDLKECLQYVDYIFPNDEEASMLTGISDVYENARLFADAGVKCVIITRGKNGCLIFKDGKCTEIPPYPVERVVDTTGAGDAFAAGFLYGLSRGLSLEACGRFGNAAASCVVEGLGASYGISAPQEVFKRFEEITV